MMLYLFGSLALRDTLSYDETLAAINHRECPAPARSADALRPNARSAPPAPQHGPEYPFPPTGLAHTCRAA